MQQFQDQLATINLPDISAAMASLRSQIDTADSPWQKIRGSYLLGRAALQLEQWDEALRILKQIQLPAGNHHIAAMLITKAKALAAHQAHDYDAAIRYYLAILELWQNIPTQMQNSVLQQDADGFTCDIYRQLAQAWYYHGAPETARTILEQKVQPLVDSWFPRQPTPYKRVSPNQNEINWRLLRLFVPWMLGQCVSWQVSFSLEPAVYEGDLLDTYDLVLGAAQLSQELPEGKAWTRNILTTAAEMLTQRSLISKIRNSQIALCKTARKHLKKAHNLPQAVPTTNKEKLRSLVLRLPWLELRFAEYKARDSLHQAEELLVEIAALYAQTVKKKDPSFRIFAVRCQWLMGRIEAARQDIDDQARKRALKHYRLAMRVLPRLEASASLHERGIRADIARLG